MVKSARLRSSEDCAPWQTIWIGFANGFSPSARLSGNQNVLSFRAGQRSKRTAVLDLVDQAAEVVTGIEDRGQDLSVAQSRVATADAQLTKCRAALAAQMV